LKATVQSSLKAKAMTEQKKLVLVDFDGVFNALDTIPSSYPSVVQHADLKHVRYRQTDTESEFVDEALISQTAVEGFVSATETAEVIWLTTWLDRTEWFPKAFGFPAFPYGGSEEHASTTTAADWWKLDYLQNNHMDREILWIDDDLATEPEALAWVEAQQGRVTLMSPDTRTGLTVQNLNTIERWVSQ
jgi:hypothetical protein